MSLYHLICNKGCVKTLTIICHEWVGAHSSTSLDIGSVVLPQITMSQGYVSWFLSMATSWPKQAGMQSSPPYTTKAQTHSNEGCWEKVEVEKSHRAIFLYSLTILQKQLVLGIAGHTKEVHRTRIQSWELICALKRNGSKEHAVYYIMIGASSWRKTLFKNKCFWSCSSIESTHTCRVRF